MPPTPTTRATPIGEMLEDGFSTLVTIETDTNIGFWEKSVQPSGPDGGDSIPITTMHNTTVHTKAPRSLVDITDTTITAAFDPSCLVDAMASINVEGTITITYPDGAQYAFFGYLKSIVPQEMSEGEQPEAEVTIVATNRDPSTKVEAVPTLTGGGS
jgi:hypothetical protein